MGGLNSGRYAREDPMQRPVTPPKWVVVDSNGREVVRLWNPSRAMAEIVATWKPGLTVREWKH